MTFPTTGLLARYEAALDTAHSSGDLLATIPDQSGNGLNAVQATASKKPTWQSGQVNGQPAYAFDSVDDGALATVSVTGVSAFSISTVISSGAAEATTRGWPFVAGNFTANSYFHGIAESDTVGEWTGWVRSGSSSA